MHETYEAPKGRWENVYEGFVPIGMGECASAFVYVFEIHWADGGD